MASEILQNIAKDIHRVDGFIAEAKELISASREAGEDTHEMEAEMKLLEIRKLKWERMLSARGL
ncbi:hypothetical protein LCGC14_1797800 [marine sediment metagenome]|uniref:Uncharacterized protein n=1 Tax=marine sediment metagenome TaxID=412755 RepID=A0A0F9HD81_9ZZZZ